MLSYLLQIIDVFNILFGTNLQHSRWYCTLAKLPVTTFCLILCGCRQVLEVLAAVRNEDPSQLAETIYRNTCNLFRLSS